MAGLTYRGAGVDIDEGDRLIERIKPLAKQTMIPQVLASIAPRQIFVNAPLGDTNFKADSVDQVCAAALPIFRMYDAEKNLEIHHPDAGHLFPKEIRGQAYQFIENALK